MDRKSILILAGCFVLFILWMQLVPKLAPPPPALATRATNAPAAISSIPGSNTSVAPTNAEASGPGAMAAPPVFTVSSAPEELLEHRRRVLDRDEDEVGP